MTQKKILITGVVAMGVAIPMIIQQNRINEYKKQVELHNRTNETAENSTRSARRSSSRYSSGGKSREQRAVKSTLRSSQIQKFVSRYSSLTKTSQFKNEIARLDGMPKSLQAVLQQLLFTYWGEVDPIAAVDHSLSMPIEEGRFAVWKEIFQSWAAKTPEGAAQYYIENYKEFQGAVDLSSVITREWFLKDSKAAFAWALSTKDMNIDSGRYAVPGLIQEAVKVDPYKAVEMLSSITDATTRERAMKTLAAEWARRDWDSAKAWILGLPKNEQQPLLYGALTRAAKEDPKTGVEDAVAMLPRGRSRDDVINDIVVQWSHTNPAAAAEWLKSSLPDEVFHDGEIDPSMMRSVMRAWSKLDDAAALNYASTFPAGHSAIRDQALGSYVRYSLNANSHKVMLHAESMSGERERSTAVGQVLDRWLESNQGAAVPYLEKTEYLSQDQKEVFYRKYHIDNPSYADIP